MVSDIRQVRRAFLAALVVCASACQSPPARDRASAPAGPLQGSVMIGGSASVLPAARLIAASFAARHPQVRITVEGSNTSDGFRRLCAGELPIAAASRPINETERQACASRGIEFIELPIAFDSVTLVVSGRNTFVDCLTVGELKGIFEPAAAGRVTHWNQVRPSFPRAPLTLAAPSRESGTFDYFTLAIVGASGASREDYRPLTDEAAIAAAVAEDLHALGYFGHAYYEANRSSLKTVAVDAGAGCVAPSTESVSDGRYSPLSRPEFVYVSRAAAERPEVRALAQAFVSPESAPDVRASGNIPLPVVALLKAGRRLDQAVVGSAFGGRGAVIGLAPDTLLDEDKIKSALVR